MAKKPASSSAAKSKKPAASPKKAAVTRTSAVRNSPVPKKIKKQAPAPVVIQMAEVTQEMIARRAYEISQSPACGGELDNWLRAERELRG